jgi:type II secretory pathway pseudopilin PulG
VRRVGRVHDRGETLIELLVSIVVLGTAVVAVVGGLGTAIVMSDIHRKQAAIGVYLNEFAATIETAVAASPTQYVDCATDTSYPSYTPGATYSADITQVRYWNGTAFITSCSPGTDTGVQLLTLRVWSNDGRVDRSMDLVIRKPCRPLDTPCG